MGEIIGLSGTSGASSGIHNHIGLKFVDKDGVSLDLGNGFYGAVNYTSFYDDKFVLDAISRPYTLTYLAREARSGAGDAETGVGAAGC